MTGWVLFNKTFFTDFEDTQINKKWLLTRYTWYLYMQINHDLLHNYQTVKYKCTQNVKINMLWSHLNSCWPFFVVWGNLHIQELYLQGIHNFTKIMFAMILVLKSHLHSMYDIVVRVWLINIRWILNFVDGCTPRNPRQLVCHDNNVIEFTIFKSWCVLNGFTLFATIVNGVHVTSGGNPMSVNTWESFDFERTRNASCTIH